MSGTDGWRGRGGERWSKCFVLSLILIRGGGPGRRPPGEHGSLRQRCLVVHRALHRPKVGPPGTAATAARSPVRVFQGPDAGIRRLGAKLQRTLQPAHSESSEPVASFVAAVRPAARTSQRLGVGPLTVSLSRHRPGCKAAGEDHVLGSCHASLSRRSLVAAATRRRASVLRPRPRRAAGATRPGRAGERERRTTGV